MTFGDPYSSRGYLSSGGFNPAHGMILCSKADFVCGTVPSFGSRGGGNKVSSGSGSHLSYSSDGSLAKAVNFILTRLKEE